jgi:hypothetical protein
MLADGNDGKSTRKKIISPNDIENLFNNKKNNAKRPSIQFEFIDTDNNIYNDEYNEDDEVDEIIIPSSDNKRSDKDVIVSNFDDNRVKSNPTDATDTKQYTSTSTSTPINQQSSNKDDDFSYDDDSLNLSSIIDKVCRK